MSAERMSGLLLRLYPPAWRARYGEELEALIVESAGGERVPWRMRLDVALAGARECMRSAGLAGDSAPPEERARSGALLVLCGWALFVLAGSAVSKFSEHWQDATPVGSRSLPAGAFDGLVAGAAIGSVLVLAGIASALPSLVAFLRAGGWAAIRRRVLFALLLSLATIAAGGAAIHWAHSLTAQQRNGGDARYTAAFLAVALLGAGSLAAWTAAAVATARKLTLPAIVLRVVTWLASAVALAMGVMTASTVIWWAALGNAAPWALRGEAAGSSVSPVAPQLVVYSVAMLIATALGTVGAARATGAVRALPSVAGKTRR